MGGLVALARGARFIGARNTLRSVRSSVARVRADRGLVEPVGPTRVPGRLLETRVEDAEVTVRFTDAVLTLRFGRPGQVSVGWDGALDEPSYAVVAGAGSHPPALQQEGDDWLVRGPGISVLVRADGALSVLDGDGRVRRHDSAPVWDGAAWMLGTPLADDATVHGLGGGAVWSLRGGCHRLWNSDPGGAWLPGRDPLYVTTPLYAVLDDLGATHCFIDNPADGTVDLSGDTVVARFGSGPVRWHVAVGSLAEVLDAYTALTGRPTPPPRWALGHHQARWGYGSAAAVREVWQRFREHDLPLSALHVDIDHMDRYRNFTLGPGWADTADLVAELAHDDVRLVVIIDAGVAKADDYPPYRDGLDRDVFCTTREGEVLEGVVWPGPTVFPDFTSSAARQWWGEQLAFYADLGVSGYWHDMNEPACFVAFGDGTLPLSTRHPGAGPAVDHRSVHNVYGLQMCRASYDGLLQLQPDRRPFLFSRSGWAGMQRYGGNWSGDVEARWPSLLGTLQQALVLGVSGVGYYGSDIGGFTGTPSPELFTRWFQLASFQPFFRTHCAFHLPRREPWEWGPEVLDRLREALQRRYALLPYWYTLALSATRDGAPMVRPLAWLDPRWREVGDEFLVGHDVLVAPVLEEGTTVRRVVLPEGVWFHAETGERAEGAVEVPVGPSDVPWFVRAGAVIPTQEGRRLVLLVAPPEGPRPVSGGRLLTDTGDGWAAPHEERYTSAVEGETVVVSREVVAPGAFDFESVSVRAIDGRPARLA